MRAREHEEVLSKRRLREPRKVSARSEHRQSRARDVLSQHGRLLRQLHHHRHSAAEKIREEILIAISQADAPQFIAQTGLDIGARKLRHRDELSPQLLLGAHKVPASQRILPEVFALEWLGAVGAIDLKILQLLRRHAGHDAAGRQHDRAAIVDDRAHDRHRLALDFGLHKKFHGHHTLKSLGKQLRQRDRTRGKPHQAQKETEE